MPVLNTATLKTSFLSTSGDKVEQSVNSNTNRANNVSTDIAITKTAAKNWAVAEDKIRLTTQVVNNTDLEISNPSVKVNLSGDAKFVEGSLKIGSEAHEDLNPIEGCTLPVVLDGLGASMEFSYEIAVDKYLSGDPIKASSQLTVNLASTDFNLTSNEVEIAVMNNEIYLLKTASPSVVKAGDEITYTIEISNAGDIDNTELFFTDPIPDGTTFVVGSVKVDDQEQTGFDPSVGFSLADLPAGGTRKVEFKVKVNET